MNLSHVVIRELAARHAFSRKMQRRLVRVSHEIIYVDIDTVKNFLQDTYIRVFLQVVHAHLQFGEKRSRLVSADEKQQVLQYSSREM